MVILRIFHCLVTSNSKLARSASYVLYSSVWFRFWLYDDEFEPVLQNMGRNLGHIQKLQINQQPTNQYSGTLMETILAPLLRAQEQGMKL